MAPVSRRPSPKRDVHASNSKRAERGRQPEPVPSRPEREVVILREIELLLEAITSTGSAAAYSLLCRFRGRPANRVGLFSYFDWDPQILVQYPCIDAMGMVRPDMLLDSAAIITN